MWSDDCGIIGIGYEGISLDELTAQLTVWRVTTLIDVRLNAISRKHGFSKRALSAHLEANGIKYIHMPALGNPKENRSAYAEIDSDSGKEARAYFRTLLATEESANALDELVDLASKTHVAVFCYEHSELNCHRREVLYAARARLELSVV